ncbi:MAG: C69 family dipeptidase [Cyclobacteriaceae bacterium]
MCDTLVALPTVTKGGNLLLAKNSDREPGEAQALLHVPHQSNNEKNLKCTYIEIPQVAETYECILSKPFQMWGAEMGANEHGLVIGNEAVFTKVKFEKHNNGLTGMDLLRLALERSKTAEEAIACITTLLEQYGQDANGGYKNKNFYYHNSFLVADAKSAWVLETAGREWATEKVKDIRSISNKLSINQPDALSGNAKSFAQSKGWLKEGPFSFQKTYSDWFYTRISRAASRQTCTTSLSSQHIGELNVSDCVQILQTHNLDGTHFKPAKANTGSVCMHATSLLNPSTTTGSMVAEIRSSLPHTVWLTGTAHPCLSIYIPFYFGTNVLKDYKQPSSQQDDSLWWQAEKLHRWISKDYQNRKALINEERIQLQREFIEGEAMVLRSNPTVSSLGSFSKSCLDKVWETIKKWNDLQG